MRYLVLDGMGRLEPRNYYNGSSAEQVTDLLNLNDSSNFSLFYGKERFWMVKLEEK